MSTFYLRTSDLLGVNFPFFLFVRIAQEVNALLISGILQIANTLAALF